MGFEITLWLTNLLTCNPDVLFCNILFMQLSVWIHFLITHILWAIFQSHLYSSILDLVGLSINLLYATLFSCTAILHSSSDHLLLSGFGCYPTVCSTVSSFNSFKMFPLSTWAIPSHTHNFLIFSNSLSSCSSLVITLGSVNLCTLNFFGFLFI